MSPTRSVPVHLCHFLLLRRGTALVCWGMAWAVVTVTVAAATFLVTVVTAVPLVLGYGITGAESVTVAGGLASFLVMISVLARDLRQVDAV